MRSFATGDGVRLGFCADQDDDSSAIRGRRNVATETIMVKQGSS